MNTRMPAVALSLCLGLGLTALLPAQQKSPPATPPGLDRPPALLVRTEEDDHSRPIELVKIDTHVVIRGFLAEATTTMTFRNPLNRVLEGEMVFPLPDGATISGYALDIGGTLTPSVAVEKHQARIAYETEMYTRIDPGLVEWTRGSNFRTRVWPINPHATRTIRISYVSELEVTGDAATYVLPLRYPDPVKQFDLKIEVVRAEGRPVIVEGDLANLNFSRWEDRWVTEASLGDVRYQADLRIAVPRPDSTPDVLVECGDDGEHYFTALDLPARSDDAAPPEAARIAVLWDVSLSRARIDKRRELDVLARHLARMGDLAVDVVPFSNDIASALTFDVRDGATAAVIEAIEGLTYDGGTDLESLAQWLGRADRPAYDYCLLFSDGLDNLGGEMPDFDEPVFTIAAASSADHRRLDHLARTSGGAHFDLNRTELDEAAARLGRTPFAIREIRCDSSKVTDILPEAGRPVGSRVVLTGRLLADEAAVTVIYSNGAESSFTLKRADATYTGLVPRHWAQMQVDELAVFPEANRDRLLALGKRFGMVTPATSLLVLERLDQYVRHRIEPPAELADLRKQYLATVRNVEHDEELARAAKIERVVAMWQQRVEWWERDFVYPDDLRVDGEAAGTDRGTVDLSVSGDSEIAPMRRDSSLDRPAARSVPARSLSSTASAARGGGQGGGIFGNPEDEPDRAGGEVRGGADVVLWDAAFGDASGTSPAARIQIKPWDPDQPYLKALKEVGPDQAYERYLAMREQYFRSPSFYLDCADFFFRLDRPALALRILTGILDLDLDNPALLRVVAHRLAQIGELRTAANLFEEIRRLRPDEPQSHRDLALVLGRLGDYPRAVELYEQVITEPWPGRFPEIEVVALMELNRLLEKYGDAASLAADFDERLITCLDLDVRIVMTWDADQTDIDLWVIEPSGERCYYSHNLTSIGGLISRDFTRGYGPEEYVLRRAMPGTYRIKAHYYGSNQQALTGATTLQLTIITNFARPHEQRRSITVRLDKPDAVVDVGTVELGLDDENY